MNLYLIIPDAEVRGILLIKKRSLKRIWISEDRSSIVVVIYDSLGPSVVISNDSGTTWTDPMYLGLHRLPDFYYVILGFVCLT